MLKSETIKTEINAFVELDRFVNIYCLIISNSTISEAIAAAGSKASRPEKKPEAEDKPAIKLKPISNLVTTSKPPESGAAGLSSFLDKVIASLKKSGDTPKSSSTSTSGLQLPSLNTSEDDTPHINRSDLFRPKPRPQSPPCRRQRGSAAATWCGSPTPAAGSISRPPGCATRYRASNSSSRRLTAAWNW